MSRKIGSFEIGDDVENAIGVIKEWLGKQTAARNHNKMDMTIDSELKIEIRAFPKTPADLEREIAQKKAAERGAKQAKTLEVLKQVKRPDPAKEVSAELRGASKRLTDAEVNMAHAQRDLDADPENARMKQALATAQSICAMAADQYQKAGGKLG
jgi:Tfp pilus assembly protein FimV